MAHFRFALAGAALWLVAMGAPSHAEPKYTPKVKRDAARTLAVKEVPGKVVHEELEKKHGHWVWEFNIRPQGETGRRIKEVNVDAETGAIAGIEDEEEGDEAAEHRERQEKGDKR